MTGNLGNMSKTTKITKGSDKILKENRVNGGFCFTKVWRLLNGYRRSQTNRKVVKFWNSGKLRVYLSCDKYNGW